MRKVLAVAIAALVLAGGVAWDAVAADSSIDNSLWCDISGPVRIEHDPSTDTYQWFIDAVGTCTGDTRTYTLNLHVKSLRPSPKLGRCGDAGVEPAPGTTNFRYASYDVEEPRLPAPTLTDDTTGVTSDFGYLVMNTDGGYRVPFGGKAPGSLTTLTISGATGLPGSANFDGAGVQANRLFLRCPTSFPSSEPGRFIFTLRQDLPY